MPPVSRLTGGPGAIAEYIKELQRLGHEVGIYIPSPTWHGLSEFAWDEKLLPQFNSRKSNLRSLLRATMYLSSIVIFSRKRKIIFELSRNTLSWFFRNIHHFRDMPRAIRRAAGALFPYFDLPKFPNNSIVVATFWPTAYASALSNSLSSLYLMQHYEEVFYPDEFEWSLLRLYVRSTYDLPLRLSSNSKWLTKQIERIHSRKVDITNINGIPNEFTNIKFQSKPERDLSRKIKVIAYARPEPWKGMATVMRAVQILREKIDVQLLFYGQVDEYWKKLAAEFDFDYMENFTYENLIAQIQDSDIMICGSWYESFPLPPLEGMFSGTPVICSGPGTEEYAVNGQTALIYRAGDPKHAADLMHSIIEDNDLAIRLTTSAFEVASRMTWAAAHDIRTNWLVKVSDEPDLKITKLPLRLENSISSPYELENFNSYRVIRDKFGHAFLLHKGVARHLHSSHEVEKAKVKYCVEIEEVSFDEMLDVWRI